MYLDYAMIPLMPPHQQKDTISFEVMTIFDDFPRDLFVISACFLDLASQHVYFSFSSGTSSWRICHSLDGLQHSILMFHSQAFAE